MVLGAMEGIAYRANSIALEPHDRLLLYTDGITEAMDSAGNLYAEPRLQEFLGGIGDAGPESLVHALVEDVKRYAGEAPQNDDITVLAIRKN